MSLSHWICYCCSGMDSDKKKMHYTPQSRFKKNLDHRKKEKKKLLFPDVIGFMRHSKPITEKYYD